MFFTITLKSFALRGLKLYQSSSEPKSDPWTNFHKNLRDEGVSLDWFVVECPLKWQLKRWNIHKKITPVYTTQIQHTAISSHLWPFSGGWWGGGETRKGRPVGADHWPISRSMAQTDPVYMSRKIRKFRTDKFDTWNGWFSAVYMSCMNQNFRLFHVSNLSVRNFRIFLLIHTGYCRIYASVTSLWGLVAPFCKFNFKVLLP